MSTKYKMAQLQILHTSTSSHTMFFITLVGSGYRLHVSVWVMETIHKSLVFKLRFVGLVMQFVETGSQVLVPFNRMYKAISSVQVSLNILWSWFRHLKG